MAERSTIWRKLYTRDQIMAEDDIFWKIKKENTHFKLPHQNKSNDDLVTAMDAIDRIYSKERDKVNNENSEHVDSEIDSVLQVDKYLDYKQSKPQIGHKYKSIDVGLSIAKLFGNSITQEFVERAYKYDSYYVYKQRHMFKNKAKRIDKIEKESDVDNVSNRGKDGESMRFETEEVKESSHHNKDLELPDIRSVQNSPQKLRK